MKNILQKGKLSRLEGGDSGKTFLLEFKGKRFVLRNYVDEKTATYYAKICRELKGSVPKVFFQEQNKLLFEYVEGRDCTKADALAVAARVGELCARINKLPKQGLEEKLNIKKSVSLLKKHQLLTTDELNTAKELYLELKKKLRPTVSMDFDDVYPENFRLDKKGNIYLVDIECMEPKIKGSGIGKAFIKWFKTLEERKQFLKGYARIARPEFLTQDMLTFLYLHFLMGNMVHKIVRKKKQNPKNPEVLRRILRGGTV